MSYVARIIFRTLRNKYLLAAHWGLHNRGGHMCRCCWVPIVQNFQNDMARLQFANIARKDICPRRCLTLLHFWVGILPQGRGESANVKYSRGMNSLSFFHWNVFRKLELSPRCKNLIGSTESI